MKKKKYKPRMINRGWFRKGHRPHSYGKTLSQETKDKIRTSVIYAIKNLPRYKKQNIKRTQFKKGHVYSHWIGKYGEESPHYNGKAYRNKVLSKKAIKCEKCGKARFSSLHKLHVHHKDGNRLNQRLSNLELLCSRCHLNMHKNWEGRLNKWNV